MLSPVGHAFRTEGPNVDASEKLAQELRGLVQRWRMEWNISTAELVGALVLVGFELCLGEWRFIDHDEDEDEDEDQEEEN